MFLYRVAAEYYVWADDDEHAVEQFDEIGSSEGFVPNSLTLIADEPPRD